MPYTSNHLKDWAANMPSKCFLSGINCLRKSLTNAKSQAFCPHVHWCVPSLWDRRRNECAFLVVQSLSCVQLFVTHGLQHARLPCPSPSPTVYSNSCPLSQWCPPTISLAFNPLSLATKKHRGQSHYSWDLTCILSQSSQIMWTRGETSKKKKKKIYIYMCVSVYVYICIHMYIHIYTHIHICIYTYTHYIHILYIIYITLLYIYI